MTPVVDVAVGDVQLVGGCIDDHVRRGAEILRIVAAAALALPADLQHELALAGELQRCAILFAASGDPHVIAAVDVNAVLEIGPFVAGAGPTPGGHERAARSNSSTGGAARQTDRVSFGLQRGRTVDDPHVIARSTATPTTAPRIQRLGSGCGHTGSTVESAHARRSGPR